MKKQKLILGNNIELLKKLPGNSIDSVVTDPPYGLSFMGKKWDYDVPSVEFWKEVYRVIKPGGHILAFGGTKTYHRLVVNIEDAGFEIRDQIQWLYGSGFPKSLNVGKAIDKLEGNEREIIGPNPNHPKDNSKGDYNPNSDGNKIITKGQSKWEGWGSALKPANEPICLARKPLSEKSIAENVLKWRTGGLNIDGCRIGNNVETWPKTRNYKSGNFRNNELDNSDAQIQSAGDSPEGRFPANLILDESAAEMLDEQSGISKSRPLKENIRKKSILDKDTNNKKDIWSEGAIKSGHNHNDSGGASRFFYVAKVSKAERNMGVDKNTHPTIKPVNLMSYLCNLITPPNGIILDPFMGSGSTGIAALLNDFRFVGMEMEESYFKIAEMRIDKYEDYSKFLKDKNKKDIEL